MKTGRNIAITIVCIILGIMLAWQYKSINFNQSIASTQNKRTEELMNELIKQQNINAELRSRLQELNDLVKQYENARADDDEFTNTLKEQLEKANVRLLGVVLSRMDGSSFRSYFNYQKYCRSVRLRDTLELEQLNIINE